MDGFAITWVVNNYNIRTEPRFLNSTESNSFLTEYEFISKPNTDKKSISHISIAMFIYGHNAVSDRAMYTQLCTKVDDHTDRR